MISYAQNFEDVLLWRALKDVAGGFYVDVGAADPDEFSVTRWFYDQGWSGVNIEPNPPLHARLLARRPRDINLGCAAGAREERRMLAVVGDTGMSTLSAEQTAILAATGHAVTTRVEVAVHRLADLLAPHAGRTIHFLKIDAEGFERAVLEGADFRRDRPWIVVIEATLPNSPVENTELWRDLIEAADYRDVWFDGLNRWFVAAERKELAERIAKPPNVFDEFRLFGQVAAEDGLRAASLRLATINADWTSRVAAVEADAAARIGAAQDALADARGEAAARVAAAAGDLAALHASTSWRITRPLRALRRAVPGSGGGLGWMSRETKAAVLPAVRQTAGTVRAAVAQRLAAPVAKPVRVTDRAPAASTVRRGVEAADAVPAATAPLEDLRQFARMFRRGGV